MHATADMAGTPDRNLMEGGSHAGEAGNSYLEGGEVPPFIIFELLLDD
uniref:Uncharacterized protein n=1 Tax=Peronospora matthiolae TaxID=2874970 RepID=A0AAV1TMF1_9STRA